MTEQVALSEVKVDAAGNDETNMACNETKSLTTNTDEETKFCISCTWKKPIKCFKDINEGDHICYPPNWYSPYRHHAIVANKDEGNSKLDLIHFTRNEENDITRSISKKMFKIQKTTENFKEMSRLKVVRYPSLAKKDTDEIIENATSVMRNTDEIPYNLCTYNCEHFCFISTIGIRGSKQIHSHCRNCGLGCQYVCFPIAWVFRFFAKFILPIKSLPIVSLTDIKRKKAENISRIILLVICILLFAVCIMKHCNYRVNKCENCIPKRCKDCRKLRNYIMWIRFSAYFVVQWTWLYIVIHLIRQEWNQTLIFILGGVMYFVTFFIMFAIPKLVRCCLKKN